ncbi:unnamed protein product [Zymoseptoria tritici ST99CH_1A5]|uniref:Uncharacterized protein n=1 Tax=Zymoseptoria tritici ST99CH_1A5 TaxID=1276529 RepID=A0A1Y6L345_ZYMTR|nr:unnamed protein product [Zymoseptoria tritici ST99CH_1A5]
MLTIDLQMMKTIAVSCLPRGFFSRSFQELAVAAPDDLAAKRIVAACQVMVDKEKKKVRDAKAAAGEATPFAATPAGKGKTWPSAPFSTGSFSSTMSSMGTLNDSQPMKIDNTREYRAPACAINRPDEGLTATPLRRKLPEGWKMRRKTKAAKLQLFPLALGVGRWSGSIPLPWRQHVSNLPSLDAFSSPASSDAYSGPFTPDTQGMDEGTFPGLGGNAVQSTQRDVKIENGVPVRSSHAAPSMQHADFHPRQLSSWPTMVGHRYDAVACPEVPAYT